jgi:CHAT domain-containing protein/tetratricopeptide (TPR) repeat protein
MPVWRISLLAIVFIATSHVAGAQPTSLHTSSHALSVSRLILAAEVVGGPGDDHSNDFGIPNAINLFNLGRYDLTIPMIEKIILALPESNPDYPLMLDLLGESYRHTDEFEKADRAFSRGLSFLETRNDTNSVAYEALLGDFGTALYEQRQFEQSKPLLEQSIRILESRKDIQNVRLANRLNTLGAVLQSTGKLEEAESAYKRALQLFGNDPLQAEVLNNLGVLAMGRGHFNEAEDIYKQSLRVVQQSNMSNVADVAHAEVGLGVVYELSGDNTQAETLYRRALSRLLDTPAKDDLLIAHVQSDLGEVLVREGRFAEAEDNLNNAIKLRELHLSPDDPTLLGTLNILAVNLSHVGQLSEAEKIHRRLVISRSKLGDSGELSESLVNLGELLEMQGKFDEAEPMLVRAVEIVKGPPEGPKTDIAYRLTILGRFYRDRRWFDRALSTLNEALSYQKTGQVLDEIGKVYEMEGDNSGAERYYKLAVEELSKTPDHPDYGTALAHLGYLYMQQGKWSDAVNYLKESTNQIVLRSNMQGNYDRGVSGWDSRLESSDGFERFKALLKAEYRLIQSNGTLAGTDLDDAFVASQLAQSSRSGAAVRQMAVRVMMENEKSSALVRERQDLIREQQSLRRSQIDALSNEPGEPRNDQNQDLQGKIEKITNRISDIDSSLKDAVPDLVASEQLTAVHIKDVMAKLTSDEALIFVIDTGEQGNMGEESFIWIITREGEPQLFRSQLGTRALTDKVNALRCGLDTELWEGISNPSRCGKLLGIIRMPSRLDPLPFDVKIAYELYEELFEKGRDVIKAKRLIFVPSGPMASLPIQVLVTEDPGFTYSRRFEDYKKVQWLVRSYPLTVLPEVSDLLALRKKQVTAGTMNYIGYGDPVLRGVGCPPSLPHQVCAQKENHEIVPKELRSRDGVTSLSLDRLFRNGSGQSQLLNEVRSLCPLPDTADEIRCVARTLNADDDRYVRIGPLATKADLKKRNETGELGDYRVIHFATHAAVAGDSQLTTNRQAEPALVLTPPDIPQSPDDDGLLTASDIAQLTLHADLVVLSACSTAAGDNADAQALSGLARAFFYAGARSLLVSNWPVYSDAAVDLVQGLFAATAKGNGKAEALQAAELSLIDNGGQEDNSSPSVWAPFSLVGE